MIVFGLPPREIRAAVQAELDCTHGYNHVSAKKVESLVEWMRGVGAQLVRDAKITGSVMNFFRPPMREKRRFAKEDATKDGNKCHCAREIDDYRCPSDQNAKDGQTIQVGQGDEQEEMALRFMDLPTELREWVYKCSVTPTGCISLRGCAHHMPAGVRPAIATSIFQLSKVVNKEPEGLLMDSTIIVNACLEFGSRPAIHRSQLPEHILPFVKSLVLVVDFTRIATAARVADWRVAQGLTGLKKLRICGIAATDPRQGLPH